jgi:hypothetical protein
MEESGQRAERYIHSKHRLPFNGLQAVISQKIIFLKTTAENLKSIAIKYVLSTGGYSSIEEVQLQQWV